MTNGEKYKNEILKILDEEYTVAIINEKPAKCPVETCESCKLFSLEDCGAGFIKWMYKEYKKVPILTESQKYFLLSIKDTIKRLKRDYTGIICENLVGVKAEIPSFIFNLDGLAFDRWYDIEDMLRWPVKEEN